MPFTVRDYLELPEGFPAQLIRGHLVKSPSPTWGHQWVVGRLHALLLPLVGPDRVVVSPIDLFLDRRNVLQPDLLVVREPLGPEVRRARNPQIAMEVLSPGTMRYDRVVKPGIYLRHGLDEIWLVDLRGPSIEIRRPGGAVRFGPDEEAVSTSVPGLRISAGALLSR